MGLTVELSGIGKSFGGIPALSEVSCRFLPGKINIIIGPNGSGKTTLLRVAALIEEPSTGKVTFRDGEKQVEAGQALMRRMTLVSQAPVLFNMTVFKNIAYGLKLRGAGHSEIKRRVDEALGLVGLAKLATAKAKGLSGGEAQRAAIARAFALRPELLFLDEPSSSLDPEGGALLEAMLLRLASENGTTIIMVTHNLFQARRLADAAFIMYGGRMVEWGEGGSLFEKQKTDAARRFLSGEVVF